MGILFDIEVNIVKGLWYHIDWLSNNSRSYPQAMDVENN